MNPVQIALDACMRTIGDLQAAIVNKDIEIAGLKAALEAKNKEEKKEPASP